MILLDTHVLVWLDQDAAKLGPSANDMIDGAWDDQTLAVSAISFWECALLHSRGRLALHGPPALWREEMVAAGLTELPLDGSIAIAAAQLAFDNKDPADRFIMATALAHDAVLVTADKSILRWRGKLRRHDAGK